jgi:hypothetical protein
MPPVRDARIMEVLVFESDFGAAALLESSPTAQCRSAEDSRRCGSSQNLSKTPLKRTGCRCGERLIEIVLNRRLPNEPACSTALPVRMKLACLVTAVDHSHRHRHDRNIIPFGPFRASMRSTLYRSR